jgi:DNA helicase-2/ATP-dependent DNA helicase PcrA
VFIVALEEGILPHSRANSDGNQLEEERRLLFVGITRARRELFLSRCMVRSFRGQPQATLPSRFLNEFPEEPIVVRDLSGVGQSNIRPRQAAGTWPAQRSDARPSAAPREFRLMTAADLAGGRTPIASATMPSQLEIESLKPGVSVIHPEYGLGRIVTIEGEGSGRKGRVAFAVGPARTFVLAKAPLRPVGRIAQDGQQSRGHNNDGRA